MQELFFEDFTAGAALPDARLTVSAEDASFFAEAFGPGAPEPGRPPEEVPPLAGWYVAALGMRLLFDAMVGRAASLGAPGIDAVTWPHPVRPGDTLRLSGSVSAVRISSSRPGMGLVTVAIALFNQHDVCVMTQSNVIMVARRGRADRPSTEHRA